MDTIPMSRVINRPHLSMPTRCTAYYPLYQSYKTRYNFGNICEALQKWNSYSGRTEDCVDKMLELFSIVNEEGNIKDIEEATSIIIKNILPLKDYSDIKEQLSLIENTQPILDSIKETEEIDRVISNHEKISNRFDVDKYVQGNAHDDNMQECVYELCSFIDTYNIGINSKYKIALEEVLYALSKNGINYDKEEVINDVTDYFLMNEMNQEDNQGELLNILEETIQNNNFADDTGYIEYLRENRFGSKEEPIEESLLDKTSDRAKDIIAKFKTLPAKTPGAFRAFVEKLLVTQTDEDIVHSSYNVLSFAFYATIIAGVIGVNVWAGLAALIVSKILACHIEFKYLEKVLKVWYKNRDKAAKKLDKTQDPEKKKTIEEYIKVMDKNIEKLEFEYDSLKADNEKSSEEMRPDNYSGGNNGGNDFGFNLDFNFDEDAKTVLTDVGAIYDYLLNSSWNKSYVENTIFGKKVIDRCCLEDVDYLAEFAIKYPHLFDRERLMKSMQECVNRLRDDPSLENYTRIGDFQLNIQNLKEAINIPIQEATLENTEAPLEEKDLIPFSDKLAEDARDLYHYTTSINEYVQAINELSLTSHFKIAIDKVWKGMKNLSAKEEAASRMVDGLCRMISRGIENSMKSENREAVIRDEILPPMSKIIKMVCVGGALYLISPALLVIGLVARFAMSSRVRTKERQLVANELDVELTMIDKYIQDADDKKDYKREKELMLLKKKLQAQYIRMRYKIKTEWNDQNVVDLRNKPA